MMRPKTRSNVWERFNRREKHFARMPDHNRKRDRKRREDRAELVERRGTPLNFRTRAQRKEDGKRWRRAKRLAHRARHDDLWGYFMIGFYRGRGRKFERGFA